MDALISERASRVNLPSHARTLEPAVVPCSRAHLINPAKRLWPIIWIATPRILNNIKLKKKWICNTCSEYLFWKSDINFIHEQRSTCPILSWPGVRGPKHGVGERTCHEKHCDTFDGKFSAKVFQERTPLEIGRIYHENATIQPRSACLA